VFRHLSGSGKVLNTKHHNNMKKYLLLLLLFGCSILGAWAQTDNDFWFAVPFATADHDGNNGQTDAARLVITNADKYKDTVMVVHPFSPVFSPISVVLAAGETKSVILTPYMYALSNTTNTISSPNWTTVDNNALHLYSKHYARFTSYFEHHPNPTTPGSNNPDIWSLKGRNALGKDFWVPFQTQLYNQKFSNFPAYSSFDIVATQPGLTSVWVTLPAGKSDAAGHAAGSTFTVTLSQGQTYSVAPKLVSETNSAGKTWSIPSRNPADRLCGSHVTSSQVIAITTKDDSNLKGSAYDMIGDQIVPTTNVDGDTLVGREYIVMRGQVTNTFSPASSPGTEAIYILATQNNTQVYIRRINGTADSLLATINAGVQVTYVVPGSASSVYVRGTKPIYAFHVSGFVHEVGGALIPTIDRCTGSQRVSFVRSIGNTSVSCTNTSQNNIFLNIMTKNVAALDSFYITIGTGARTHLGNSSWFSPMVTLTGTWYVLKDAYKCFSSMLPQNTTIVIDNKVDVFHLGLVNGVSTGGGCRYGYFSNYNAVKPVALVQESGTNLYGGCGKDTIQLQAYDSFSDYYLWLNNQTYIIDALTISNPRVVQPYGFFKYRCKVSQPCAGFDTVEVTVARLQSPVARFTVDKSFGCSPVTVTLKNESENGVGFNWFINQDSTAISTLSMSPFTHTFYNTSNSPRVDTVVLKATSSHGCVDEFRIPITIYPNVIIDSMILSDTIGCHPLPVSYRHKITGPVDHYIWDFGDNASSSDSTPSHTYSNFGTVDSVYQVRLVARKYNWGDTLFNHTCADTAYKQVIVHPFIKANFTYPEPYDCTPFDLRITNSSLGRVDTIRWNFGDGSTSAQTDTVVTHQYVNSTANVQTNYIKLYVSNYAGCHDSLIRQIDVYPQVKALFSMVDTIGCNPLTTTFTNHSTNATYYSWEYGDGASSTLKDTSHLYQNLTNATDTFTVQLVAMSDDYFCSDTTTHKVVVHAAIDADFSVSTPKLCAPDSAIFTTSVRGGITSASWNFGDASPAKDTLATRITHYYRNTTTSPVTRTVTLTVANSGGCTDSAKHDVLFYPEIDASFGMDKSFGCHPLRVAFTNYSTPVVTKYLHWDFADSTSSDSAAPVHWFKNLTSAIRTYDVKLFAISEYNCKDSAVQTVTVGPFIEADFTIDTYEGCTPLTVTITNTSRGGVLNSSYYYSDDNTTDNTNQSPVKHKFEHMGTPHITLTVNNGIAGCSSVKTRTLDINAGVIADFDVNTTFGCQPLLVKMISKSSLIGTTGVPDRFEWSFGDSTSMTTTSSKDTVYKLYQANYSQKKEPYTVRLTASSQYHCSATAEKVIDVFPYLIPAFSMKDANEGCSPLVVNFTNETGPGNISSKAYEWNFGNGKTVQGVSPQDNKYEWNGPGDTIFHPTLTVWYHYPIDNNDYCKSSITHEVIVHPAVDADYTEDTLAGCNPLTVNFTSTSFTTYSKFNINTWDFGDFQMGSGPLVAHTYVNTDTVTKQYAAQLISRSEYNCADTVSKIVTVHPTPRPYFEVDPSNGCPPLTVNIRNVSSAGDTCHWDFGDGTDTITGNISSLSHVYENLDTKKKSFKLNMRYTSQYTCEDINYQTITAYTHVYADFEPKDTSGCNPVLIPAFRNKTIGASKYQWYFGDGDSTKVTNPPHEYLSPSPYDTSYTVTLIASSDNKCKDTATTKVYIFPQPKAEFILTPSHLYYPDAEVLLYNQTNAGIFDYLWNFKDGQTTTERDPISHKYATWGNYLVHLEARNQRCSDSISHMLRIYPPVPIPEFGQPAPGCVPHTIQFTDQSIWATSWLWEFDDGGTSTEQNPSHTFLKGGRYNVKLTVSGEGGSSYIYHDVEVYPAPTAVFSVYPPIAMLPDAKVQFYNTSLLGTSYLWDFGDGQQSAEFEPNHQYSSLGEYNVSLSVWTEHGCFDSMLIQKAVTVVGEGGIIFPNAFTPNKDVPVPGTYSTPDLVNEVFHPYWRGVTSYHLEVYNRWGEKLFETDDINEGWNGYYKGNLCKTDVYVWYAKGKYTNGKTFNLAGNVTLLR
jgi:PKD repeat protein